MVECKLKKREIDPKTKDTARDGVIDTMRVVLVGKDKTNEVDWTLTLKYEGSEMPKEYRKALGKSMMDTSFATLGADTQQGRLD